MKLLLILTGCVSLSALFVLIALYGLHRIATVSARHIAAEFPPEADSNEALRNWLICHPGMDIDDFLNNKPDRCVIA
jgi:hypothetical protein